MTVTPSNYCSYIFAQTEGISGARFSQQKDSESKSRVQAIIIRLSWLGLSVVSPVVYYLYASKDISQFTNNQNCTGMY